MIYKLLWLIGLSLSLKDILKVALKTKEYKQDFVFIGAIKKMRCHMFIAPYCYDNSFL